MKLCSIKIFVLTSFLITLAACTPKPHLPIRIGTNVWPGYEPLYLARELNYYSPENIRMVEYSSASEVIQAFRNGAIEAAALTMDEVLLLAETTSDLSVILILDFSNGADVILAQPAILSLHDLKGKRVGLETTALGAYILTRVLESVNLTPNDIQAVSLEIFEHEKAFKQGKVDALVTFEPVKTRLLRAGAHTIFDSSRLPMEIIHVLVAKRSLLTKKRGQISLLVRSWQRALDFIKKNPNEACSLMGKRENLDSPDFQKAIEGLRLIGISENRNMLTGTSLSILSSTRELATVMLSHQLIDKIPETKELFDSSFVREVKP